MKAAVCTRYGPPEVLQIQDVPRPIPSKNEVCVRNFASAVTFSDCRVRAFDIPTRFKPVMGAVLGFRRPRQPILGLVVAGRVDSVGRDVTLFQPGDEVYGFTEYRFGGHAQYVCVRQTALLARKPASLTYAEAAAIPYGGLLALHFLRKANLQKGQRVLVYGASGAIGTSAVQLVQHLGATAAGVCSGANVELVRSLGAYPVIDYKKEDFRTRGERYDLVFNAAGKRKAQLQPEGVLKPNGRHVTVDDGLARLRLVDMTVLNGAMESGQLKPVIDRCYRLEEIVEANRYVDQGHKKGNVIVAID